MEKEYICIRDLENNGFAEGYSMSVEDWRCQGMDWAELDGDFETIDELEKLDSKQVLDYIQEYWNIEIVESNKFATDLLFKINDNIDVFKGCLKEYYKDLEKKDYNKDMILNMIDKVKTKIYTLDNVKLMIFNTLRGDKKC